MDEQPASGLPSIFDDGDVYDLVLKDIPYGLDFYVTLRREASGPVLDVACGTGRILLPCLQAGVDIEGLDLFEPMLKTLRAKAAALGLSPRLHQADMSDFSVPRRFKLIMIPFNAYIHNMTQETQIRCLQRCREHLLPGGMLAFDTFFPSLEIVWRAPETRACSRGDSASANRPANPNVRYAQFRSGRAGAALAERDGASGRRWERANRSSLGRQHPVYLQARNDAASTRRRLRALGNLRRLRPPPALSRERRDGRHGLERVNRTEAQICEQG